MVMEQVFMYFLGEWALTKTYDDNIYYLKLLSGIVISFYFLDLLKSSIFVKLLLSGPSTIYHKKMIKKVTRAKKEFFDRTPCGEILNRFSTDVALIDISIP